MPSLCFIRFNESPAGIYSNGQILSGVVDLTTDQIKAIRGIYITIRGYADVRWSETETYNNSNGKSETRTVYYTAHDEYFVSRTDVMNTSDGSRFDLFPGQYHYNFQIQLPSQLPSSFVGKHGEVRYEVSCTIDRPWRFDNVFKQPFTILSSVDLNANPMYRQPVDRSTTKNFSRICCCGNGGNIFVKGYIPYSGFAAGQSIPVKLFVKNLSRIRCHEANIKLIEMAEYRSYQPYSKSNYDLVDVTVNKFGALDKFQERELSCSLRIPAVPPSTFQSCKIIEISYFVEVELKTTGFHTNMKVRLPITIGTVPLYYGATMPQNVIHVQPSTSQSAYAGNLETAPPSYEDAVRYGPCHSSNLEENQHIKQIDFVPKYPVYHYSPETATAPSNAHGGYPTTGGAYGPVVLGTITVQPSNEAKERF